MININYFHCLEICSCTFNVDVFYHTQNENDKKWNFLFKDQTRQLKYVAFIHSLGARLSVVPPEP